MDDDQNVFNKRMGISLPRSILLPPYLYNNPYFQEYTEAIDHVWSTNVDSKIDILKSLRNMWVTNPGTEQKIYDKGMLDFSDWSIPERELLVKQVNMLGMKLKSAGILSDANYHAIARFVGDYWFGKGTESFIEFINYVLDSSNLLVHTFWSENTGGPREYANLTVENADGTSPGTPIWEGGTWFPTTHVEIEAKGGLENIDVLTLTEFFYEISNYTLVLRQINISHELNMVDRFEPDHTEAEVVAIGLLYYHPLILKSDSRNMR